MIAGFMDSQQRVWIGTNRELLVLESLNQQDAIVSEAFPTRYQGLN